MLTSPRLYQALLQETFRLNSPKRLLLVGAQIPELALKLINSLSKGDELTIIEGLSTQLSSLRQRLEQEPAFIKHQGQITFSTQLLWELDRPHYFQAIILSYPIDLLSDEMLQRSLEACANLLREGGTVSCLEMAWVRKIREFINSCWRRNSCQPTEPTCLERYLNAFRVYKETIVTNLPPVWVNHLRFTPSPASQALEIHAVEGRSSLALGPIKVAKDILRFILTLGGLSWGLKRWGIQTWYWPLALLAGVAVFLRDPRRHIQADRTLALSACDGQVLEVATVQDPHLGQGQWLRIATFLSLFDVHINRAPLSGKVVDQFDVQGGYAAAQLPKANHNYSTYLVLETEYGPVVVAQRVGLIARRIHNWVHRGELLAQGERYGLIRMGSRTDVYLPADRFRPLVKVGDKIAAGLTPIAALIEPAKISGAALAQ